MTVVVVDRRSIILGVLRRKAPGIGRGGSAAGNSHRAEGSVLVMRGGAVVGCDDFGDVLVAVVSVEIGVW